MGIFKKNEDINAICEAIQGLSNNKKLSDKELKKKVNNSFNGSLSKFKTYLESISIDFKLHSDRPQAYYWVAVMDAKYGQLKSSGKFVKSDGELIVKNALDILFSGGSFSERAKSLKVMLDSNGIILRNSEFIQGSNINGCILNKEGQLFIYMNDKQKREYQYIYTLVSELKYLYTGKKVNTAELIKFYEKKFKKSHTELDLAMEIFESDELMDMKWELLRAQTKKRINFKSTSINF